MIFIEIKLIQAYSNSKAIFQINNLKKQSHKPIPNTLSKRNNHTLSSSKVPVQYPIIFIPPKEGFNLFSYSNRGFCKNSYCSWFVTSATMLSGCSTLYMFTNLSTEATIEALPRILRDLHISEYTFQLRCKFISTLCFELNNQTSFSIIRDFSLDGASSPNVVCNTSQIHLSPEGIGKVP